MAFVKNIDEIKKFAGITDSSNVDSIMPDINDVEENKILPILGNSLYASLLLSYKNNTIVADSADEKLLFKIQKALINIALQQYSSLAQLDFSDSGIRQIEDATFKSPKQWQIDDLRDYFFMKGYRAIDELLLFLEENKATFTTWANDTKAYTINKKFIVSDTNSFQKFYDIKESRTTFMALQPTMRIVEMMHIMPNLSVGLYNQIKAEIEANSISSANQDLMDLLQLAITQFTVARAIDTKIIEVSNDGVYSRNYRSSMDNSREKMKATASDRQNAQDSCMKIAESAMENLRDFLNSNASAILYNDYFTSPLYVAPATEEVNAPYVNFSNDKVYVA